MDETFARLWALAGEPLDDINRRAGGESQVLRVNLAQASPPLAAGVHYLKRQQRFYYRERLPPWRQRPLVWREFQALRRCQQLGLRVPGVSYFGLAEGGARALLITGALTGMQALGQLLADPTLAGPVRAQVLTQVGCYLLRFHRHGLCHGALYPKHIFVAMAATPEVALIDLEKCRRRLLPRLAAVADLSRLLRHGQLLSQQDVAQLLAPYAASWPAVLRSLRSYLAARKATALAAAVASVISAGREQGA